MSWSKTYTHTLAIGIDSLGAAIFFNEPDLTISSLAWIVRSGSSAQQRQLELYGWQRSALVAIGAALEYFWPGHCASARLGDISRSERTTNLLGPNT